MKPFFSHFRGDFFGGLTAGIVALPLALAFGVSSGLGPSAGLCGAIFVGFFAALFGGTNTQISGPTAPMTAVSMVLIAGMVSMNDGDVEKALPGILSVFILAGLFQVGLGLLGLGKYIRYIPYPVVSGFMTAIGLIIIITQMLPALGYYPEQNMSYVDTYRPKAKELLSQHLLEKKADEGLLISEHLEETLRELHTLSENDVLQQAQQLASASTSGVIGALKALPEAFKNINVMELALSLATILIIFGFRKITKTVPSTLVGLLLVSATAHGFGLEYRTIAQIPEGLPLPKLEIFTQFNMAAMTPYIFTALTLALLGAIDSLLTSVVADNMTKTKHNPNKELLGQGIGNVMSALFAGLPGAGATIRTVVNINSGGRTRLSGMIAGVLLLLILLTLGPVASKIPAAVLAGILITVGIGVMDYKGLRAIPSLPKDIRWGPLRASSEVIIMLTVVILSTFWDLIYAVGIGLVIASLMFMKKMGDLTAEGFKLSPLNQENHGPHENHLPKTLQAEVFVKHLKGPLFFGSTSEFQKMAAQIPPTAHTIIIECGLMDYMDQSGLYALEDVLIELRRAQTNVLFVDLLKQPRYMMERVDMIPDLIPEAHVFATFGTCMKWVEANTKDTV